MAPWWWFPCKPKHVGAVFLILKCFNNSTFFNIVCISWKLKCWILLMHGVTMKLMFCVTTQLMACRKTVQITTFLKTAWQQTDCTCDTSREQNVNRSVCWCIEGHVILTCRSISQRRKDVFRVKHSSHGQWGITATSFTCCCCSGKGIWPHPHFHWDQPQITW